MNILTVLCAGGWMPGNLSEGWRRMGHTVHEFLYGTHMGKSWSLDGLATNADVNRRLLETARNLKHEGQLDLIFAVIYDDVLDVETAKALRALGSPMVNYHVDLVGQWYRILRTGRFFDRIACAQRDHWRGLARAGIRPYYMPMASNPVPHVPARDDQLRFDGVTYMGSPWTYRRQVLAAVDAAGVPLRVYGHNWHRGEAPRDGKDPSKAQPFRKNLHDALHYLVPRLQEEGIDNLWESAWNRLRSSPAPSSGNGARYLMGAYRREDFGSLARGTAINLGFTHFRGAPGSSSERRQVRLREFEIPMVGGFYLTQDCEQLRELFEPGRDVACWNQIPDLIEKIVHYRDRPEERDAIAAAAQASCLARHTWQHRFAGLLAELGIKTHG